jgi:hypothetical protein
MVAADEHALIAPRRNELVHWIVELQPSLLPQHHQPHARDRLGHRVDAEDRVGCDRAFALDFEMSQRLEVRDLSPAGHQRERAGQLAGVDVAPEMIADTAEACRRQSDFFGLHEHVNLLARAARLLGPDPFDYTPFDLVADSPEYLESLIVVPRGL